MDHQIAVYSRHSLADCPLCAQEHKYWEESFRVYERGVALFKYPHVRDIWLAYLQQFVQRYAGSKLERARDLFKQALAQVTHQITFSLSMDVM